MKIHFVGIKGVGMTNLALVLKKMGYEVQGSDVEEEYITDILLKKYKIPVFKGFSPENIRGVELIIFTGAHKGLENIEVKTAFKKGIPVYHLSEFIGKKLLSLFKTRIGVAGTHGKTTTSSILSYALLNLNQKLGYIVGAPNFNEKYEGGDFTGKDYFVLEADEYAVSPPIDLTPKFFYYSFDFIVLTTLDFDHPDVFKNKNHVKEVFREFLERNVSAEVFFNAEDTNLIELTKTIRNKVWSYGYSEENDIVIVNQTFSEKGSEFELELFSKEKAKFKVRLLGSHNVLNTTGVIGVLYRLGFSPNQIKKAVEDFFGAKRRLEFKGYFKNTMVFDDYGHHPTEIKATLNALKTSFPDKKILAIFQPHTYSRTQALLEDFAKAFDLADYVFILPIFASAREKKEDFNITSQDLVNRINVYNPKAKLVKSFQEVFSETKRLNNVDIILTIGAGDVYKCLEYFPLKNEK